MFMDCVVMSPFQTYTDNDDIQAIRYVTFVYLYIVSGKYIR